MYNDPQERHMDYEKIFSPDLVVRITRVHAVLHEVLPNSDLDYWIRGFIGESRPETEAHIFEGIAVVYLEVISELDFSVEEKKELYVTLVALASGYILPDMGAGLPAGAPELSKLEDRFKQAYKTNERP